MTRGLYSLTGGLYRTIANELSECDSLDGPVDAMMKAQSGNFNWKVVLTRRLGFSSAGKWGFSSRVISAYGRTPVTYPWICTAIPDQLSEPVSTLAFTLFN